jgi:CheY-like chemotaxis protein
MAQSVLAAKGYQIVLAHDGEESVETCIAHRDLISLALLDVIMPRRCGPEVYAAIKPPNPCVSVFFCNRLQQ